MAVSQRLSLGVVSREPIARPPEWALHASQASLSSSAQHFGSLRLPVASAASPPSSLSLRPASVILPPAAAGAAPALAQRLHSLPSKSTLTSPMATTRMTDQSTFLSSTSTSSQRNITSPPGGSGVNFKFYAVANDVAGLQVPPATLQPQPPPQPPPLEEVDAVDAPAPPMASPSSKMDRRVQELMVSQRAMQQKLEKQDEQIEKLLELREQDAKMIQELQERVRRPDDPSSQARAPALPSREPSPPPNLDDQYGSRMWTQGATGPPRNLGYHGNFDPMRSAGPDRTLLREDAGRQRQTRGAAVPPERAVSQAQPEDDDEIPCGCSGRGRHWVCC